jgi:hypothetical protein
LDLALKSGEGLVYGLTTVTERCYGGQLGDYLLIIINKTHKGVYGVRGWLHPGSPLGRVDTNHKLLVETIFWRKNAKSPKNFGTTWRNRVFLAKIHSIQCLFGFWPEGKWSISYTWTGARGGELGCSQLRL